MKLITGVVSDPRSEENGPMYLINVYKHGKLQFTEITNRETAVGFTHLIRRLGGNFSATMEAL